MTIINSKALILLAIQASSLLTPVTAQDASVCTTLCTSTTNDATADFSIKYTDRCHPTNFLAKVTDVSTHACLVCLYNSETQSQLTTIEEVVEALCIDGYKAQEFAFGDISKRGPQFDNEHYSGGGEWNYEIETASGEDRLQTDANRVNEVYYYEAQRKVIEFPVGGANNIESLNPHNPATVINGIQDLDGCDLNAAYCCFAQDRQAGDNNGNCATPYEYNCVDKDPADNANICYADHSRSSKASHVDSGFSIYGDLKTNKENIEGPVHCHGLAWTDDPLHRDTVFKGNLLFYVSMYDHLTQRGYARNIPGSSMCACAENMAVVTRADCTQVSTQEETTFKWDAAAGSLTANVNIKDVNYNACTGDTNNDLYERTVRLNADFSEDYSQEKVDAMKKVLVGKQAGQCNAAIETFLGTKNITRTTAA